MKIKGEMKKKKKKKKTQMHLKHEKNYLYDKKYI